MNRNSSLRSGRQEIPQSDVGKRTAHHHAVIAPPRAVGIEILLVNAMLDEVTPGRAVCRNASRWRDMIGGDRITDKHQDPRPSKITSRLKAWVSKERRFLNVCGVRPPFIEIAATYGNRIPHGVAIPDVGIRPAKHLGTDSALQSFENL